MDSKDAMNVQSFYYEQSGKRELDALHQKCAEQEAGLRQRTGA